jgi:cyclase
MSYKRIIPRLDIKGPNLVKGIHLEGLRVLGKPEEFAKYYYENGADELMLQDVVASLFERNSLDDIISKIAKEIFIPLTVGGGLRTIEDIQRVLRFGADKVAINTAAIKNPDFVKEAANKFGSSTIVIAIEAIKESDGRYLAYVDNGRDYTGIDVFEWAKKVEELGAGEIFLTSVDKDGTGEGFDSELIKAVVDSVSIPVIAHGGAGKKEDVIKMIKETDVHSIANASIFHYDFVSKNKSESASNSEGNVEFLKSNRSFHNFETTTVSDLKNDLLANNIKCRN